MGGMMGYFAHIENGIVTEVISVSNNVLGETTLSFPDTESAGRAFIANTLGLPGEWRQTSYNASFRFNYAGIGDAFDPNKGEYGAFIASKPFPSWVLDEDCKWQPPIPYPLDDEAYVWDEEAQEWQAVTE